MARSLLIVLVATLISAVIKPTLTLGMLVLAGLFVYALFWPLCAIAGLIIAGSFVYGKTNSKSATPYERARIRACDDDTPGANGNRG